MVRRMPRWIPWTLALCTVHFAAMSNTAEAVNWFRPYIEESQPDVFYNFFVPGAGHTPAAMYPAPHPTPPRVGHTYYTYQPWMPHEQMYAHRYTQHQYYDSGFGLNRYEGTLVLSASPYVVGKDSPV